MARSVFPKAPNFFCSFLVLLTISLTSFAQSQAPRIFYTDITSGPNTGGQSNRGAFVTIYGNNFGSARNASTVTVGGSQVASYPIWTNSKIVIQLGSSAVSGNIVVNVNGVSSNAIAFTVRAGRIFFVSTSGSDSNSGSYSYPWATLTKARSTVAPGDIVYLMNGVAQTGADLSSASLVLTTTATSTAPIAFLAYPGATATIGSSSGQTYGVRTSGTISYMVLGGLSLRGAITAVDMTSGYNWRLVGNDISCPYGSGASACVSAASAGGNKLYGNRIHDIGSSTASSLVDYEAVSFKGSNSVDIGWNEITNVRGCRAIRFSSTGSANYNLKVHDNFIHDVRCDAVSFENVDASLGSVLMANNVVARAGTGPAPGGVEASYACVAVGSLSSSNVVVRNNTMYDCGARKNSSSGAINADSPTQLTDNIVQATTGESYIAPSNSGSLSGSNNLFYGAGSAPSAFTASVNSDARLTNPSGNDFHLQSGSPAIDRGTSTASTTDIAGNRRPQGAAFDIGAYESAGSTSSPSSGTLSASTTALSFGSVATGSYTTQSVTFTNTGSTSLTISSVSFTGSGFTGSGLSTPTTLAAGQSATLTVKFSPTSSAAYSSTLTVSSNASNSTVSVSLSGTGIAATTNHSVSLSWVKSTSSGVTGYNVYRSTVSGSSYTKVNSSLVTGTSYSDTAVTSGKTYYYVVRSVGSTGTESANSSQVSAVIP